VLTIGALAELAGTTMRTIRHYHAVGVLPEPARRGNGYRVYDLRDAVHLVRVRRLVGLGLSLPEIKDALRPGQDDDRELREILLQLDADLARQERALGDRRRRLAELLARDTELAVSDELADLLRQISGAAPGAADGEVDRERELLEMAEASNGPQRFGQIAASYRAALADPGQLAAMRLLAARFEALETADPDDPEVERLAGELADAGLEHFPAEDGDESWRPAWEAFLVTLSPAQRRCMQRSWERRSACAG
jgi:DNA-binding transcriptional MerR regulator